MILGIDVSKWQKEMDWAKAQSAGAKFAFIRAGSIGATSGIAYTDYQFETNERIAPDYMPVGFYWYFRPQHCALDQAEYFCNLIRGKRWLLPPVMDLESSWGMSATEITEAAKIFITQVYVRLEVWPLLYSRGSWLNSYTVDDAVWDFVGLWVARYADLDGPWSDGYYKPDNFDDWEFWQKSAGGNGRGKEFGAVKPGASVSMDIDYFNGDQAAFDEYIGTPVPVPGVADDIGVKVDIEGVKYRGRIELVK
jgi:lysozyme